MNNVNRKTNKWINWITVWCFIFGCIGFNLYVDAQQVLSKKNQYRARYEAESQRADSLYKETIRLEQHLQKIEATTLQRTTVNASDRAPESIVLSEL